MQISNHIVQSPEWAEFKSSYGTKTVRSEGAFYTKHKIPFSSYYVAYCPKVNPTLIDWEKIRDSLISENCVSINFDVPNVTKDSPEAKKVIEDFQKHCQKAPKSTFATNTIFLDLTKSQEELLSSMHPKHRYNMKVVKYRSF